MNIEIKSSIELGQHEIKITLCGTYTRARAERGPSYACGGEPAEPASIDDLQVFVEKTSKGETTLEDITWMICDDDIQNFEDEMIEYAKNEEEEDYRFFSKQHNED